MQNLPVGFKFSPTDAELFLHYLIPKVNNELMFQGIIHEDIEDIYICQPVDIPILRNAESFVYFFTRIEKRFNGGSRTNRCTKDGKGCWKQTNKICHVRDCDGNILGLKNTLVFNLFGKDGKTNWIMHEYILDKSRQLESNDIVLCRIYENKKEIGNKGGGTNSCIINGSVSSSLLSVDSNGRSNNLAGKRKESTIKQKDDEVLKRAKSSGETIPITSTNQDDEDMNKSLCLERLDELNWYPNFDDEMMAFLEGFWSNKDQQAAAHAECN